MKVSLSNYCLVFFFRNASSILSKEESNIVEYVFDNKGQCRCTCIRIIQFIDSKKEIYLQCVLS